MRPKNRLNRIGFSNISKRSRGAVRIDVTDIRRVMLTVIECCLHRRSGPCPFSAGEVIWWASALAPNPDSSARIVAPRAVACSNDSSTKAPAPSLKTKPSRFKSQGLLASVGESLRALSAFMEANPAMVVGDVAFSAPPAIMTSASP